MIIDGIPLLRVFSSKARNLSEVVTRSIVSTIERALGARVLYDATLFPAGNPNLADIHITVEALRKAGVLARYYRETRPPDEPPVFYWRGITNSSPAHTSGGSAFSGDKQALTAMLSETLERYLWSQETDFFSNPCYATVHEIARLGSHIPPERFVSFTQEERQQRPGLKLSSDAQYLWIRAYSLTTDTRIYVPAQTACGTRYETASETEEPLIRDRNTSGLATWPTQNGARLAGILELLERDAYMIMWLNQLSPSRIDTNSLLHAHPRLSSIFDSLSKYGLSVHILKMPTDAPTHALCAIIEDASGVSPRFALGLKAHWSLVDAVEKAIAEALRARVAVRQRLSRGTFWEKSTPVDDIGHRERLDFWADAGNAEKLLFLIKGKVVQPKECVWDSDTEHTHLKRIIAWCKENNYECLSISLTASAKNPTNLHIEQVIMPDLQPTYLHEGRRHFAGSRLKDVPKRCGYRSRSLPFKDAPHPFS